jgi:hypothetical protein
MRRRAALFSSLATLVLFASCDHRSDPSTSATADAPATPPATRPRLSLAEVAAAVRLNASGGSTARAKGLEGLDPSVQRLLGVPMAAFASPDALPVQPDETIAQGYYGRAKGLNDADANPLAAGYQTPVKLQATPDSCTAFAIAAVIEGNWNADPTHARELINFDDPQAIYAQLVQKPDMQHALEVMTATPLEVAPGFRYSLAAHTEEQASGLGGILNTITGGPGRFPRPVPLAVELTPQWADPGNRGIIDSSVPATGSGHAIAVFNAWMRPDLPGGGVLIFKNSFGPQWGDQGYGYLPLDYCVHHRCWYYGTSGTRSYQPPAGAGGFPAY